MKRYVLFEVECTREKELQKEVANLLRQFQCAVEAGEITLHIGSELIAEERSEEMQRIYMLEQRSRTLTTMSQIEALKAGRWP